MFKWLLPSIKKNLALNQAIQCKSNKIECLWIDFRLPFKYKTNVWNITRFLAKSGSRNHLEIVLSANKSVHILYISCIWNCVERVISERTMGLCFYVDITKTYRITRMLERAINVLGLSVMLFSLCWAVKCLNSIFSFLVNLCFHAKALHVIFGVKLCKCRKIPCYSSSCSLDHQRNY